jgi:hypothetical protein
VDQKLDNVFSLLLEDADGMNLVGGKEKRVCSKIKHKIYIDVRNISIISLLIVFVESNNDNLENSLAVGTTSTSSETEIE